MYNSQVYLRMRVFMIALFPCKRMLLSVHTLLDVLFPDWAEQFTNNFDTRQRVGLLAANNYAAVAVGRAHVNALDFAFYPPRLKQWGRREFFQELYGVTYSGALAQVRVSTIENKPHIRYFLFPYVFF